MKKNLMKKTKMKKKIKEFFNTLKPILIFSFIINVVLLGYVYYLKNITHVYLFSGRDEYLQIDSGSLSTSYDINYLIGNNIDFIGKNFKVKEIKIGYYIMNGEKLNEIITYYEVFEESTNIKDVIDNLTVFNVTETEKENNIFKNVKKDLEFNLYLVMEVKKENGDPLLTKLQLDVSKLK